MEQSVEFNSGKKFKAIAALTAHTLPIFLKKTKKPWHGNLVLITSSWILKVELQLWLRTNFLQVLTYYSFLDYCAMMMLDTRTNTYNYILPQFFHVSITMAALVKLTDGIIKKMIMWFRVCCFSLSGGNHDQRSNVIWLSTTWLLIFWLEVANKKPLSTKPTIA